MEHTKTPWKLDLRVGCLAIYPEALPAEQTYCLDGANNWAVHFKQGRRLENMEWEVAPLDQANAAFIVRACNSHDQLVEACHSAIAALVFAESYGGGEYPDAIRKVEAALAKTREE